MWKMINEENSDIPRIREVYPTKQNAVARRIRAAIATGKVTKIVIFGSCITSLCHRFSDIDMYCELTERLTEEEMSEVVTADEYDTDIVTNFMVDESLMREINKKGIVFYERG